MFNLKIMREFVLKYLFFYLAFFFINNYTHAGIEDDALLKILKQELQRETEILSKEEIPLYYLDYRVNEIRAYQIRTSMGSLISDDFSNKRILTTTVRVGDYSFDNTHEMDDWPYPDYNPADRSTVLALENNPYAIKQSLWFITNILYKTAVKQYKLIQNNTDDKDLEKPDFSKETPCVYYEENFTSKELNFNKELWIKRLKSYSNRFLQDTSILNGNAVLSFTTDRKSFVSSEGTMIAENSAIARLQVTGNVKNNQGNIIPVTKIYVARHPDELPSSDSIMAGIDLQLDLLRKMKKAPLAEPYAGPAILSAESAGVFFHEIFGHRVEGHRLRKSSDSHTFKDKIGDKVLPKDFTVVCDPTITELENTVLIGSYKYDDEGVKGQRVVLVENGALKGFLMSRKVLKGSKHSTGHGRAEPGYLPVTRQSNLIVSSEKTLTEDELRKNLIKECKKQGLEYGYYFKDVVGGFTSTDRYNPNVFNIFPSEVYKIFVDGRPDELVTGVRLIGTPLTMFSNITKAGDSRKVFTGYCGAESGQVPVTAVSPAILVKKVETQRAPEQEIEMPILPRPME